MCVEGGSGESYVKRIAGFSYLDFRNVNDPFAYFNNLLIQTRTQRVV